MQRGLGQRAGRRGLRFAPPPAATQLVAARGEVAHPGLQRLPAGCIEVGREVDGIRPLCEGAQRIERAQRRRGAGCVELPVQDQRALCARHGRELRQGRYVLREEAQPHVQPQAVVAPLERAKRQVHEQHLALAEHAQAREQAAVAGLHEALAVVDAARGQGGVGQVLVAGHGHRGGIGLRGVTFQRAGRQLQQRHGGALDPRHATCCRARGRARGVCVGHAGQPRGRAGRDVRAIHACVVHQQQRGAGAHALLDPLQQGVAQVPAHTVGQDQRRCARALPAQQGRGTQQLQLEAQLGRGVLPGPHMQVIGGQAVGHQQRQVRGRSAPGCAGAAPQPHQRQHAQRQHPDADAARPETARAPSHGIAAATGCAAGTSSHGACSSMQRTWPRSAGRRPAVGDSGERRRSASAGADTVAPPSGDKDGAPGCMQSILLSFG
ncbi:hypothetical protein [Pseudorhodoferax sp. Leaf267]|uniref:hypothetical protein n=1 Tax=Pseudorhodoferax sp. Leaf267 TaxID=1736316 RepID=UPI0012E30BEB|nr:hypothetical protein [Pseudorhodoferax sp. Leaf267]